MMSVSVPASALLLIRSRSTSALIQDIITTGKAIETLKKDVNPDMFTVRGWLFDELESRNPDAFNAWIDSDADDDSLPLYFN